MYLQDIFHYLPMSEKGARKVTYQLETSTVTHQPSEQTRPGPSARPLSSRTHLMTFAEGKPEPKLNTSFATSTLKSFRTACAKSNVFGLLTRAFHRQKSCRVLRNIFKCGG